MTISVFDGGGKPDWRKFAMVADRCGFGLAVTRDGDPVEILIHTLRELKDDVQERYVKLSDLPAEVCPEGKLTRAIARDPSYGMPVRLLVLDEFQEYFNTGNQTADQEIADLLVYLVRVAPATGVILGDATQRPSGIGSGGEVARKFTDFRDSRCCCADPETTGTTAPAQPARTHSAPPRSKGAAAHHAPRPRT